MSAFDFFSSGQIFKKEVFSKKHDYVLISFPKEVWTKINLYKTTFWLHLLPKKDETFSFSALSKCLTMKLKISLEIGFWKWTFWKKTQILNEIFSQEIRIWIKIIHLEKNVLTQFTPQKRQNFYFWCFFKMHDFEAKNFNKKQIVKWIFLEKIHRLNHSFSSKIRFWIYKLAACQILNLKKLQRVRFWYQRFKTCQILQ